MRRSKSKTVRGPDNSIIFVCGRKGSGKSTLVHAIAMEYDRVFVLDTLGSEGEPDFEVVNGLDACVDAITDAARRDRFRISLRCPSTDDLLALLPVIETVPNSLLVIDETSFYCSPSYLPEELSSVLRYGRHAELSQVYVARRPSEIHREVTAAADVIITFQHHEPRDVAHFKALAGERFAETVRSLPRFKVAVFGDLSKVPTPAMEQVHASLDNETPHD